MSDAFDALASPVLVLNRVYQPVQVTTARRAFVLLYAGAALAYDDGDLYDFPRWSGLIASAEEPVIPTLRGALRIPRVLHLNRYDKTPRSLVRLSRRNLMLRDELRCQYCGKTPGVRDLNIDHVFPRSRGGPDTWENLVTACRACNVLKANRTPEEAGLSLLRPPRSPRWSLAARLRMASTVLPEWEPFLAA
jgi:5-methylcytosine-specific restriction endonuclease McrA